MPTGGWKEHIDAGWASCAITENGFVPIVSQQGFAAPLSVTEAINVLRDAKDDSDSEYGPDDLSITDAAKFGSKAVTPIGRNHRCLPFGNGRSKAKLLGNF